MTPWYLTLTCLTIDALPLTLGKDSLPTIGMDLVMFAKYVDNKPLLSLSGSAKKKNKRHDSSRKRYHSNNLGNFSHNYHLDYFSQMSGSIIPDYKDIWSTKVTSLEDAPVIRSAVHYPQSQLIPRHVCIHFTNGTGEVQLGRKLEGVVSVFLDQWKLKQAEGSLALPTTAGAYSFDVLNLSLDVVGANMNTEVITEAGTSGSRLLLNIPKLQVVLPDNTKTAVVSGDVADSLRHPVLLTYRARGDGTLSHMRANINNITNVSDLWLWLTVYCKF
jgi:hypothetical protein